jgi:Zn-dependent peptidase ImmA (M78 family)
LHRTDTDDRVPLGKSTMEQRKTSLPITDPRAHALRHRFHAAFAADELPVPIEAIAEDLLGLHVEEAKIDCSGMLLPTARRIVLRADEPAVRRRFTLAHEVGHWVCQVKEGHDAPAYCRAADIAPEADRLLEREANVFAAELLMPEPAVREGFRRAATTTELAKSFGVSDEAMGWRMYNLGLVLESPAH